MMNRLETQREYRKLTGNAATKKYEKTPKGFLMRKYRNMVSRVGGIQKKKHHLYKGKRILSREEFYNWALNHEDFWKLFEEWQAGGYDRKLCPTVNRKDTSRGYEPDNMEWLTHSENSRLGGYHKMKV